MQLKLNFELVPDSCQGDALRHRISKEAWDFLRHDAYDRANGKCMICGKQHCRLEAHEKWEYDIDKKVQKLVDIIAVCKDCHSVIHIGRTQLVGDEKRAEKHFMKVNNCTYSEYRRALGKANERHRQLNLVGDWLLDLTFLRKYID